MEVDSETRQTIEALLKQDEETLRHIMIYDGGAGLRKSMRLPPMNMIREAICPSPEVRELVNHPDRVLLVAAVMDALSGLRTGLNLAAMSVLWVKRGIDKLCADQWCQQDEKG